MKYTTITVSDKEYQEWLDKMGDILCGMSCGSAVDVMVNYVKRPDCSKAQLQRLIKELTEYENTLK